MYFYSRAEAGRKLALKLLEYQTKNCAVIALSPGAILVGAQIAIKLHSNLMMLTTENIEIPGENNPLGAVSDANIITYNQQFSTGEIEEFNMEYFNFIEQQRLQKVQKLHRLMDANGQVRRDLLKNHVVIVVADGLSTGLSLDVAGDYLKPIRVQKLIAVAPVASPQAVDRMRLFSDEVHCLSVAENFVDVNHYFEDNTIPDKQGLYKIVRNISLSWDRPEPSLAKSRR
jgi:predicted phosphoribosyltransferase